jgi:phage terminase large subunit-like protein
MGSPAPRSILARSPATKRACAGEAAQQMVRREPEMQDYYYGVEALAHSIAIPGEAAAFEPLSRDADSLEGHSPHGAIIDELHAHKTREVFDVINQATGSRRQSLILQITTAGDNRTGVCYEQHDYVTQVLQGRHRDERYFAIIYTIDPEDFNMLAWQSRCKIPGLKLEEFYGKRSIVALELASKVDVAAKIMLFHEDCKRCVFGNTTCRNQRPSGAPEL